MLTLHGTFLPGAQKFVLCAEQDELAARKQGRRGKPALHPFGMTALQLAEWVLAVVPHVEPGSSTQILWLPSYDKLPQPSPELAATGAIPSPVAESLVLKSWKVEAVELSVSDAVDFLLALADRPAVSLG